MIIREIRVVGELVPVHHVATESQAQHRGLGKLLVKKAESICIEYGCKKILVIAGIGVRLYFYALGYQKDGPYVSKILR